MKRTVRGAVCAVALAVTGLALTSPAADAAPRPLALGIYPGGYAGGGSTDPLPDDPAKVVKALNELQDGPGFLVREYVGYNGTQNGGADAKQYFGYLGHGRKLDLVLSYPGKDTPLDGWLQYVRTEVRVAGPRAASISLGVDVNLSAASDPSVVPAVVAGVEAAKDEARRLGLRNLEIGFDEGAFGRAYTPFWQSLAAAGGEKFRDSIDYVGVELYPDVFFPGPGDLGQQAVDAITVVRTQEMPIAGLGGKVAIHVAENGWDTLAPRTEAQQSAALTSELTAISANRAKLDVTAYEYFDLRDDKSGSTNMLDHLGLLNDDYTPKAAFQTYRRLVRQLKRG
ncbi:hypothetical protein OG455_22620 [Kitasatospora sp. NBC_01287]|uniref:hypothetical protein n=1 Tax=Kitasatospora sp. NBC_01287 TaxID=2903573 RepID=UPI002252D0AE|nr:hypothetical protein [Kitasatospora sp. NBC_01287]MCX4748273.1 hypothetical protein [Kitasatospora sp. NBC_01287]